MINLVRNSVISTNVQKEETQNKLFFHVEDGAARSQTAAGVRFQQACQEVQAGGYPRSFQVAKTPIAKVLTSNFVLRQVVEQPRGPMFSRKTLERVSINELKRKSAHSPCCRTHTKATGSFPKSLPSFETNQLANRTILKIKKVLCFFVL